MKKTISLITAALLAVGTTATAMAVELNVSVEGTPVVWTDAKPFIDENSRTLVPLRPIANALGLDVSWDDNKNQASFTDGETTAVFTIGEKEYSVFLNDTPDFNFTFKTDTAAVIASERTYAPARYLAECFRYEVRWDEPTKSVTIVKMAEDAPVDDTPALPSIPAGEKAAAEPMVTDAGVTAVSTIALKGMVEGPDIFAYDAVLDSPVDTLSHGLMVEDGYLLAEFQPKMNTAPGTYTVTWTLPGGWFADGEDVVVRIPLTVNKTTVATALAAAVEDLSNTNFYVEEGASAEEINAKIMEDFWLFHEVPFELTVSDGEMLQDEFYNNYWKYTVKVTDTVTGESMTGTAESGLEYDSFNW